MALADENVQASLSERRVDHLELQDALICQNASTGHETALVEIFGLGQLHGLSQSPCKLECS